MEKKHNFTALEKKTFLDILKKYSGVIENKQTDGSSLKQKNDAWERVAKEYNSSPLVTQPVTTKQLRRLWMNTKQRQREAITKQKQHCMATGGGPSVSDADIDPDVAQITSALIVGVDEAIDSNTPASNLTTETSIEPTTELDFSSIASASIDASTSQQCISFTTVPPSTVTTLPPPTITTPPPTVRTLPPPPPPQTVSRTQGTNAILEKEYNDRKERQNELHNLQKEAQFTKRADNGTNKGG